MARDARVFEKNMSYFTLITLHLLAAVVWIGGMLFLGLVLVPVLRGHPSAEGAALLRAVGRRFLPIGWTALATLLVTGTVLWSYRGFAVNLVLAHKLVLVAIVLALSVLHDFVVGPGVMERLKGGGQDEEAVRLRRRVVLLARLNVLCAVIVLILGLAVSRGF